MLYQCKAVVRCPSCGYIFVSQQRAVISYLWRPEFRPKSCNLLLCNISLQNTRLIVKKKFINTQKIT